ncbi:MAG: GMC family oxidoreductase [Leptospirales bacterium]|nr:GMC family oxidoreductase [Leptospirales bacterium]
MNSSNGTQQRTLDAEYDYIIVGSGFGGSVSAMRLAQKGYRVLVLEAGKRWRTEDFPRTNWRLRKFLWRPSLFCYGIQRIDILNHVMALSGAGVGGGSLVYANTLYVPPDRFFENETVQQLGGKEALLPFYSVAQKMLGVVQNQHLTEVDQLMRETAGEMGRGESFVSTPVGVYFGDPKQPPTDPYFGGEGPERQACNFCGGCMVGCRFHAKNTLDKNYLYFAQKLGAVVLAETQVEEIVALGEDGHQGYELHTSTPTGWFGLPRRRFRTRGLVLSAGVLGTVNLLLKMKERGRLPRLSARLGQLTRTNSEAIIAVKARSHKVDYSRGIAITSSVYVDEHTHIEPVRYSKGSDAMGNLVTLLTDGGGKIPRPLRYLGNVVSKPIQFLRTIHPFGFAKRSIILLVMQTLDNSISLIRRRRWLWPFQRTLTTAVAPGQEIPTYIPDAHRFARILSRKIDGIPESSIPEVLFNIPTTAHVLGGACIGASAEEGVIDLQNRVFGYQNLLVCDGSMIPGNLGVNPSLSITAFTERAMSFVPSANGAVQYFDFERKWKTDGIVGPAAAQGGAIG